MTRREIDSNNSWDSGTYEYKLSLPNKPLRIFAQAFQGCSSCCTIGSNFCSEPASFAKNAALYFYGESTLETSQYGVTINIALLNCDCRGC